jgi:hypothetical protein
MKDSALLLARRLLLVISIFALLVTIPFRDLATTGDGVRLLARPARRILPVHRPVLQSLQRRRARPRRSRHRHEPSGFPLRLRRNQASSRRRG